MNTLLKCGVLGIICLLPLGAWAQNPQSDAVKTGDSAKSAEPAMKVDSATKGTTGESVPAASNKMAPGSQGAGSGTDNSSGTAAPAPADSEKMNGASAPPK
jgi:hypothetical protein